MQARRFGEAATAATVAVRADPLRESARAALIRVHLAEGNQSDALDEFHRYRTLIRAELDLEPTPLLATSCAISRPRVALTAVTPASRGGHGAAWEGRCTAMQGHVRGWTECA